MSVKINSQEFMKLILKARGMTRIIYEPCPTDFSLPRGKAFGKKFKHKFWKLDIQIYYSPVQTVWFPKYWVFSCSTDFTVSTDKSEPVKKKQITYLSTKEWSKHIITDIQDQKYFL